MRGSASLLSSEPAENSSGRARAARRAWFEEHIQVAEQAAKVHNLGAVYRVINTIAPRKRREKVRIRGAQGELLSPKAEFDEIFTYFSNAFRSADECPTFPDCAPLRFSPLDIEDAIHRLKGGKAVPDTSLPSEVWKMCAPELASYLARQLNTFSPCYKFPPEVTDCALSLLPKPNKPGKRPTDLRPLGLQDPSSKLVAAVVRDALRVHTEGYLQTRPQYAYIPNKSIDMAVARVSVHCRAIRDALSRAVCSVHDRRAKRVPLQVAGGVMLGIDLSRAFDEVPRWALLQSLQHAGATEELQRAVMQLHDSCRYRVKHKGHSGTFSMQKGVRQGCALSPYLYALFSCLIYDTLAERTNPEWAARAITLFADDTHIAWTITSVRDLQFVMTCIQHTFQVFRDFGMRVHPENSQIIVKVRGSAAIR